MYRNLKDYDGGPTNPSHDDSPGEYDYEIPDDMVVGSPGGLSTTYHHYTHGFYGRGNTSSDVYAGEGNQYISGVYGNLYNTGGSSAEQLGLYPNPPDPPYWQHMSPQNTLPHGSNFLPSVTPPRDYTPPFGNNYSPYVPPDIEGYEPRIGNSVSSMPTAPRKEHLPPQEHSFIREPPRNVENFDDSSINVDTLQSDHPEHLLKNERIIIAPRASPFLLLFILILLYIAFDFWAETSHLFIKQVYGDKLTWTNSLLLSLVITCMIVLLIWFVGVPLTEFESV